MPKHYTGICVDEDAYHAIAFKAGQRGHSFSSHLNYLLHSLSSMKDDRYQSLVDTGVDLANKNK